MTLTRRRVALTLVSAGVSILIGPLGRRLFAHPSTTTGWPELGQGPDQAPNRREFALTAHNYGFVPERLEVTHDDLVKITIQSTDQAHSFTIDEYRIVKRVPAGGSTTFEFRADRTGTFNYYCNLTSDAGCRAMRGQIVVRPK